MDAVDALVAVGFPRVDAERVCAHGIGWRIVFLHRRARGRAAYWWSRGEGLMVRVGEGPMVVQSGEAPPVHWVEEGERNAAYLYDLSRHGFDFRAAAQAADRDWPATVSVAERLRDVSPAVAGAIDRMMRDEVVLPGGEVERAIGVIDDVLRGPAGAGGAARGSVVLRLTGEVFDAFVAAGGATEPALWADREIPEDAAAVGVSDGLWFSTNEVAVRLAHPSFPVVAEVELGPVVRVNAYAWPAGGFAHAVPPAVWRSVREHLAAAGNPRAWRPGGGIADLDVTHFEAGREVVISGDRRAGLSSTWTDRVAAAGGVARPRTESQVLRDIPAARLADLAERKAAGRLTAAEDLAIQVLAGGDRGEAILGPLIDLAMQEFGYGSYRVPVRVVGDRARMKVVVHPPREIGVSQQEHASRAVEAWVRSGRGEVIVLPGPGWSVDVYEVGPDEVPGVEVADGEGRSG